MEWWPLQRRRRPVWRRLPPRPRRGSSMSETRQWRVWSQVLTQLPRRRPTRPTSLQTLRLLVPTRLPRQQWRGWRTPLWQADLLARLTFQKQKQENRLNRLHSRLCSPRTNKEKSYILAIMQHFVL